jgi:AraC-like DNA-binding protein
VSYVLRQFSEAPDQARTGYAAFVAAFDPAATATGPSEHPSVSGTETFIARVLDQVPTPAPEVPQRARPTLAQHEKQSVGRNDAMKRAYATGNYSLAAIARHFGLHYSTVSRICRETDAGLERRNLADDENVHSG